MINTKLSLLFVLSLLTSCATLVNGPREKVSINTNPPGAVVTNGEEFGITPTSFTLERENDYVFVVEKPGYVGQTIKLHHKFNNWTLGNIVSFGIIGAGIDSVSGAIWRFDPDTLTLTLQPLSKTPNFPFIQKKTTVQELEKPLPF